MNPVPVMNLGRGPALSGSTLYFDVEFRHGKKSVIIPTYIDSGARRIYARIPKKFADDLGIEPTHTGTLYAHTGTQEVPIGQIDYISIPKSKCTVANGKIIIGGEEEVASLGQPFLAATGATIEYYQGRVLMDCSEKMSPIGVYPQFSFDLAKGGRRETVTAILDTGFTGGISVTLPLARKLGLEKSSEVDVMDASGRKYKAGVTTLDRVSFTGHSKCAVEGLEVYIYPEGMNAPVLVGEKFLKGMPEGAYLGFDENGAWAGCQADDMKIKAARSVYEDTVPREQLPEGAKPTILAVDEPPSRIPWVVGAVAIGAAAWFFMKKSPQPQEHRSGEE